MRRWRPPDLKRLFVGLHIVNGVSVGVGVIAIALAASAIFGFTAGQPATLGAISASISDLPAPWREKARTMGFGFALALIATSAIGARAAVAADRAADDRGDRFRRRDGHRDGTLGDRRSACRPSFRWCSCSDSRRKRWRPRHCASRRCSPQAASPTSPSHFSPRSSPTRAPAASSQASRSANCRSISALSRRSSIPNSDLEAAYGAAIRQQAALSEQLQSARALLLDRARRGSESLRLAATIGILLDAFDALVAAQCDVAVIRARRRRPPCSGMSGPPCASARSISTI